MNTPAGGVTLPELPEPQGTMNWTREAGVIIGKPEDGFTAEQMREYARAALAGEWRVPEGFVLVPRKPTLEMLLAAEAKHPPAGKAGAIGLAVEMYRAMLSAAPLPEEPGR